MSSAQQNFNAGQTQGQTQVKAEEFVQSTKETASAATDKANAAANTTGQTAQQNKDESAGFLQQTGEQVKNMAQGAVDSVKHTLGMDKNHKISVQKELGTPMILSLILHENPSLGYRIVRFYELNHDFNNCD
ncbi:Late embryogenesis abundant protein 2 [Glycine soja]